MAPQADDASSTDEEMIDAGDMPFDDDSPGARLCRTRELIAMILEYLKDDRATLQAALYVGPIWTLVTGPFYWAYPPKDGVYNLLTQCEYEVHERCAGFIKSVILRHNVPAKFIRTELDFRRLEEVSYTNAGPVKHVEFLLTNNLRSLEVTNALSAVSLVSLSELCPNLRNLKINSRGIGQDWFLLAYLQSYPTCFAIELGRSCNASPKVLEHLLKRTDLRRISIEDVSDIGRLRDIFMRNGSVLQNVVSLTIPAIPELLRVIYNSADSLENLTLRFDVADFFNPNLLVNEALFELRHFSNLRRLVLESYGTRDLRIQASSLPSIWRMRRLEYLALGTHLSSLIPVGFATLDEVKYFFSSCSGWMETFVGHFQLSFDIGLPTLVDTIMEAHRGLKVCWIKNIRQRCDSAPPAMGQHRCGKFGLSLQVDNVQIDDPMNVDPSIEAGTAWDEM